MLSRNAILPRQPQSPGHYRGMWPLLLAVDDDYTVRYAIKKQIVRRR